MSLLQEVQQLQAAEDLEKRKKDWLDYVLPRLRAKWPFLNLTTEASVKELIDICGDAFNVAEEAVQMLLQNDDGSAQGIRYRLGQASAIDQKGRLIAELIKLHHGVLPQQAYARENEIKRRWTNSGKTVQQLMDELEHVKNNQHLRSKSADELRDILKTQTQSANAQYEQLDPRGWKVPNKEIYVPITERLITELSLKNPNQVRMMFKRFGERQINAQIALNKAKGN